MYIIFFIDYIITFLVVCSMFVIFAIEPSNAILLTSPHSSFKKSLVLNINKSPSFNEIVSISPFSFFKSIFVLFDF